MRTQDLLRAFAAELDRITDDYPNTVEDAYTHADAIDEEEESAEDDAAETLVAMFDALESFAPDGCYFGAHPGDGADYGYWEYE
jgi:hypothetical protein